jgi:hypothetical protein
MGRYDTHDDKNSTGVLLGLLICVLAGLGAWYYWRAEPVPEATESHELILPKVESETSRVDTLAENTAADLLASGELTLTQPDEQVSSPAALPELTGSDPQFRDAVAVVSPQLVAWLGSEQLISRNMTLVNDFSQGLRQEKHMRFLKPKEAFVAEQEGGGLIMSDKSYSRFDALAAAIAAIDVQAAMRLYQRFKPLLLQVYEGYGYPPERPLEDIFLKAAAQILAAPVLDQPPAVVRSPVLYKYRDEKLEALNPVAKQMLRMGPENTRIIQDKLRELVESLVNAGG